MAKTKWDIVKSKLDLIEKWAREGIYEKDMIKQLGIGKTSWEKYKKEHPELCERLKRGSEPLAAELENKLIKRARGFHEEESKTYIKTDETGKTTRYQEITKKYYPPDVGAIVTYLKNKDKDDEGKAKWSNDPAKIDIKKEELELRKKLQEEGW